MNRYLLIESRDPYSSGEAAGSAQLAVGLRRRGHEVTLLLVQNGVQPARREAQAPDLHSAIAAGVEVLADEFALRERGVTVGNLTPGVRAVPLSLAVERMVLGWTPFWR